MSGFIALLAVICFTVNAYIAGPVERDWFECIAWATAGYWAGIAWLERRA